MPFSIDFNFLTLLFGTISLIDTKVKKVLQFECSRYLNVETAQEFKLS